MVGLVSQTSRGPRLRRGQRPVDASILPFPSALSREAGPPYSWFPEL